MIVVVTNRKGGVGKSTLATHAAVRLAMTGRPTVLIDADMQATSSHWADTRARNALEPQVDTHPVREDQSLLPVLKHLVGSYNHAVVDVGATAPNAMHSGLRVAHRLIIPSTVSHRDLEGLEYMAEVLREVNELRTEDGRDRLSGRVVFNKCSPLPNFWPRVDRARERVAAAGLEAIQSVIMQRVAYDDCHQTGSSVLEGNDEKSRPEIAEVLLELLR